MESPLQTTGKIGRQAEKSAATREHLLQATIDCLNEKGYHGTSTNDVVDRAGSSRGALLHHFPNRKKLFTATAVYLTHKWLQSMQVALVAASSDADRVESGIQIIGYLVTQPDFNAFMELTIASRTDDDLRHDLLQLRTRFITAAEEFSRALFPRFVASSPDWNREFHAMIHYLEGLALSQMITKDRNELEDSLRFMLEYRSPRDK